MSATLEEASRRNFLVTILIPPIHPRTAELFRQEFAERYAKHRELLVPYCIVDFTSTDETPKWPASMFGDSVHLTRQDKPMLTEALTRALPAPCGMDALRRGVAQK